MELFLGLILSLTAAVVGVRHISNRDRPIHGPRDDGTLGIPHLQRWSEVHKKRRFESIRRNAPYIQVGRIVKVTAAVVVVAIIAFAGYSGFTFWQSRTNTDVANQIGDVILLHSKANSATDPAHRYDLLLKARDEVESLAQDTSGGHGSQQLADEKAAIDRDLDELRKVTRLASVQPVARLPQGFNADSAQLFTGGGNIYLFADALYEVQQSDRKLVSLIRPGDVIEGVTVGELQGAAWREDGPLVLDDAHAYIQDLERGTWDIEDLGLPEDTPPPDVAAMDIFDFNLYILDTTADRILKYDGGDYLDNPENWTEDSAPAELAGAQDILVDSNIYTLLADGRVLNFYLGDVQSVLSPQINPPFGSAVALASDGEEGYFYIANAADGRIAKVTTDGELIQQYESGPGVRQATNLHDFIVDQSTGIAYLLADDLILTTRLDSSTS